MNDIDVVPHEAQISTPPLAPVYAPSPPLALEEGLEPDEPVLEQQDAPKDQPELVD